MESSRWSRWVTIAAVLLLSGIAAVVSYSHMYELALRHGEPEWRAALFPLSVDGMIVGASMTLLSDARHGRRGGLLPWTLLVLGSSASLAANVAVADPTMWSRIIHAWPSFALIGAYELLMREFRTAARSVPGASAADEQIHPDTGAEEHVSSDRENEGRLQGHLHVVPEPDARTGSEPSDAAEERQTVAPSGIQVEAWRWALENRRADGSLPTEEQIAVRFGRKERWGRLIKQRGQQGWFEPSASVARAVSR